MKPKSPRESNLETLPRRTSRVLAQTALSPALYELLLDPAGLTFTAGDEILLHGERPDLDRTYSIASGEAAEALRLIYRVISDGARTPDLPKLQAGDAVDFTGPTGSFHLQDPTRPCVFVATGTGIAPAISFIETHPELSITLIHGIREEADRVYDPLLGRATYIPCYSRIVPSRAYSGRVTNHLLEHRIQPGPDIYLCGSNDMIEEARAILTNQDHENSRIRSEPYYFW